MSLVKSTLHAVKPQLKFKLVDDFAQLPRQAPGSVGWDVFASESITIDRDSTKRIRTGLILAQSPRLNLVSTSYSSDNNIAHVKPIFDSLLKIESRSGLASRGIIVVGGIVDPNYRGEISVMLYNGSCDIFNVKIGDRIAQFVWYPVVTEGVTGASVSITADVEYSDRGSGGFGSTGI